MILQSSKATALLHWGNGSGIGRVFRTGALFPLHKIGDPTDPSAHSSLSVLYASVIRS